MPNSKEIVSQQKIAINRKVFSSYYNQKLQITKIATPYEGMGRSN